MKPFFWDTANFGDNMNTWIWNELFPNLITETDGVRLVGIGTLIKSDLEFVRGKKIICGSGAGYGPLPLSNVVSNWRFYFVRGPRTARALGLDDSFAVVDGAWLISVLPEFQSIPEKKGVIFIPHWTSAGVGVWRRVCDEAGISYVDPLLDSKDVIRQIASSRLAIVEAMHGSIIADYFRTPWIPVKSSKAILDFKWLDWCDSIDTPYEPVTIAPSDALEHLWQGRWPRIYSDTTQTMNPVPEPAALHYSVVSKPHSFYSSIQRTKPFLRRIRHDTALKVSTIRNIWPISRWNSRHIESLANAFRRLSNSSGYLSADKLRQTKIDQLEAIIFKIREDFGDHGLV